MADPSAETNWLDVLKAAFWPALVLLLALVFFVPARTLLTQLATGMGPAQEIEVGPLKLQFSAARAQSIPPPPADVADVLAKMTASDIDALLEHAENTGEEVCRPGGEISGAASWIHDHDTLNDKFVNFGLTEFKPDANGPTTNCKSGDAGYSYLSDDGKAVRRYLIDLLTKSLVISKS